jgi:uncharacterized membrane protein YgcG
MGVFIVIVVVVAAIALGRMVLLWANGWRPSQGRPSSWVGDVDPDRSARRLASDTDQSAGHHGHHGHHHGSHGHHDFGGGHHGGGHHGGGDFGGGHHG